MLCQEIFLAILPNSQKTIFAGRACTDIGIPVAGKVEEKKKLKNLLK